MKTALCSLILIAPHSPRLQKIRVSYRAAKILVAAFILAFCVTVFLGLLFPRLRVNESHRARLAAENQMLRVENKNLTLGIRKIDSNLSRLEGRSQNVIALMEEN